MSAQSKRPDAHLQWPIPPTTCNICLARDLNICSAVDGIQAGGTQQSGHVVPSRRVIWRGHDLPDMVPFVCSGWAATVVPLSNGRRQIVSFLLPGDIVSTTLLFEWQGYGHIEAISDVRCRAFNRSDLRALLRQKPELWATISKTWVDEKARADALIADLGRRTAEERIARMILNLVDRLAKRDMVSGEPVQIAFPLRQHHIADATGLTSVHVNKVLAVFRRGGLIATSGRALTLLDPARLKRVAGGL